MIKSHQDGSNIWSYSEADLALMAQLWHLASVESLGLNRDLTAAILEEASLNVMCV